MSKNLKKRIESLMERTESTSVLESCKAAISKFNEYAALELPASVMEKMESVIAEEFISKLNDEGAIFEFSDIAINNLGVRNAIAELGKINTSQNMPLRYVLEKVSSLGNQPEWLVYEQFISALKPFDFEPSVLESINSIKTNANKYAEDIKIHKSIYEAKISKSNYILPTVQPEIDDYLAKRTASARSVLLEKLNKYLFDPTIKKLYNIIVESAKTFEIKATSNDAVVKKVYSPVIITNESEIFAVQGKAFRKRGNDITPLTENEVAHLPEEFIGLANFINQSNVEVSENNIKIFSKDKKLVISESETGDLTISVNEKTTSPAEFSKIYLTSGMFNSAEIGILRSVHAIVENWNNIFEIDYVKSIYSKAYPNRRADVFKCGNTMHINTVDTLMNENLFHPNCTAHQSRNHILEFVNYDLSLTFNEMMSPEKRQLSVLENKKSEYSEAIQFLEKRKKMLEGQNESILSSPEIKELIEAIEEEIDILKKEYYNNQSKINSITKISEGVGYSVGDTAEYLKKK
jgi:hypothetical protein